MSYYDDQNTVAHVTRNDKWKTGLFALVCLSISFGSLTFVVFLLTSV